MEGAASLFDFGRYDRHDRMSVPSSLLAADTLTLPGEHSRSRDSVDWDAVPHGDELQRIARWREDARHRRALVALGVDPDYTIDYPMGGAA